MISDINILWRTLKSHGLDGRRSIIALKTNKDLLQNRMGLVTLYIVLEMWVQNKLLKIMMILARLNLAFFVTMSNFFPNTLFEIYLDVLVIVKSKSTRI